MSVDISVLGDKKLARKLRKLDNAMQKKIIRQALRDSAKRLKVHVVDNLSGVKVGVIDDELRTAYKRAKVRSASTRGVIRLGIEDPKRDTLGIHANDEFYYPFAVEYGHGNVPAHSFLRTAVDEHSSEEFGKIARRIGMGIRTVT